MKKLFMLAGEVEIAAVCLNLWMGKDDVRRFLQMRNM